MRIGYWMGTVLAVVIVTAGAARGQTVVDAPRGFTFDVPRGFHQLTEVDPKFAAYAFGTSDPRIGLPDALIALRPMDRAVRRDVKPTLADNAPKNSTLVQRKWGSTDVWMLVGDAWYQGYRMNGREVQIPLEGDGLTVALIVRQGSNLSADALLDKALAGLHAIDPSGEVPSSSGGGETDAERGEHLGYGLAVMAVLFTLAVRWMMTHLARD